MGTALWAFCAPLLLKISLLCKNGKSKFSNLKSIRSFTSFQMFHTHTRQELDHCNDPSGTESHNMQLNKTFRGGVLGLAPCHVDRKINKIARTFAQQLGWAFVPWPPCKSRSFTSVQMLHTDTHTPGRSRVNPERQEEEKSGHQRRANGQNSAGGREQTNLQNQPTRRNGPNQHRAHPETPRHITEGHGG